MPFRLTTWNVNGIKNPMGYKPWSDKRTFDYMFDTLEADIVIAQELKIQRKDLRDDMVLIPGWDCYFSLPRHKKGYSGVGIFTRNSKCAPIRAEEGLLGVLCPPNSSTPYCELPSDQNIGGYLSSDQLEDLGVDATELDSEGRCVALEFPAFVILGIYSPANSSGLRDGFREGFLRALDARVRNLVAIGKRVVVTGDLNVSREEIDTANATERLKKEGITQEEYLSAPNRRVFNQLLDGGKVIGERDKGREKPVLWDICRGFHPTRQGMYTHWEQKINARPGNFGARIDFVLCSLEMKSWFCESDIQEGLMGSDHCPVYAVMQDMVDLGGQQRHLSDIMNPPGMFQHGKRLRDHSVKDLCAFSAKLMPEFDKRRSIKDMFGRPSTTMHTPTPQEPTAFHTDLQGTQDPLISTSNAWQTSVIEDRRTSISMGHPTEENGATTSRAVGTASPERKRKVLGSAPNPISKRSKSNVASMAGASSAKGQQSLKGFFTSRITAQKDSEKTRENGHVSEQEVAEKREETKDSHEVEEIQISSARVDQPAAEIEEAVETEEPPLEAIAPEPPPSPDNAPSPPDLIDPIVSKESWSKLFSKPTPPRCEGHNEPCQILKTKKPGIHCGREFWMCARPLGPTGEKERNTQWRCPTFMWASEWNGRTEQRG